MRVCGKGFVFSGLHVTLLVRPPDTGKLFHVKELRRLPVRTSISSYDLHEWGVLTLSDKNGWFWNRGSITDLEGELSYCRTCGYVGHNRKNTDIYSGPDVYSKIWRQWRSSWKRYSPEIIQPQETEQNSNIFPAQAVMEGIQEEMMYAALIIDFDTCWKWEAIFTTKPLSWKNHSARWIGGWVVHRDDLVFSENRGEKHTFATNYTPASPTHDLVATVSWWSNAHFG
jgi:hypothetical protein